jgi:hypothetical protein
LGIFAIAYLLSTVNVASAQQLNSEGTRLSEVPPPSAAEQDKLLDAMHRYADNYVSNLPNFICEQTTRQFQAGKKSDRWRKGDTLTSKLTFNQGREHRNLVLVNGKQLMEVRKPWKTPLITEGEFGVKLSRVLGAESGASFTWSRWEELRGKRLAVFAFSVDKAHSTMTLGLSDLAKAIVPYSGEVYGDPATGVVWRITDTATEIPAVLQTESIGTTIDYGEITIGNANYILPLGATVLVVLDRTKARNELEFANYRKFGADSSITFGSEEPADPSKPR